MKRHLIALIFAALVMGALAAQGTAADYLSFLPQAVRQELMAKGTIGDMGGKIDELKYWQSSPFASVIRSAYGSRASTIAAESWLLLDKPAYQTTAERDLKIFKSFTAFTTMKGLLVYSESLKKMETFIYDSYRIDSLTTKRRLPDPEETAVPDSATYYLYQKEEQTGDVYSEMKFISHSGWYEVALTNQTPMKYLFLTLVEPHELLTSFYLVPTDDKLLLYSMTIAKTPTFMGIEKLKRNSFFNRMKALASWVQSNLAQ
jgi:hypothetical protein